MFVREIERSRTSFNLALLTVLLWNIDVFRLYHASFKWVDTHPCQIEVLLLKNSTDIPACELRYKSEVSEDF